MPQGSAIDHICFSFILSAFINTVFITCRPRVMTLYSVFEVTFLQHLHYTTLLPAPDFSSKPNGAVDRRDEQMDGHSTVLFDVYRILREPCNKEENL